jgi:exopolysaccharide production protein ExoZ
MSGLRCAAHSMQDVRDVAGDPIRMARAKRIQQGGVEYQGEGAEGQDRHQRLLSLQILRGVSAWMVVAHHIEMYFIGSGPRGWLGDVALKHGNMGVDVFFVISGVVMHLVSTRPDATPVGFISDRLIRIVPPYWVCTTIAAMLVVLVPQAFAYTSVSCPSLLASLFFVPTMNASGVGYFPVLAVGWTLNMEMFFYVIILVSMVCCSRYFTIGALALLLLWPFIHPSCGVAEYFAKSTYLGEFAAGILLGLGWRFMERGGAATDVIRRLAVPGGMVLGVFLLGCGMWTLSNARPISLSPGIVKAVLACALVGIGLLCEERVRRMPQWMTSFLLHQGDLSYSIYLTHLLVVGVALAASGCATCWSQSVSFLTIFVVTYGIALLLNRTVERRSKYFFSRMGRLIFFK